MAYTAQTSFVDSLQIGKAGELLVQDYLRQKGYTVIDLSEDADWQSVDVDMEVAAADGRRFLADVKTDTECWLSDNIILETKMHRLQLGIEVPGWYSTSAMDVLYYLCAGSGRLFTIDFKELQRLTAEGTAGHFVRFRNPIDPDCIGEGILIHISELSSSLLSCETLDTSSLWKYDWRWGKPGPF